MAKLSSVYLPIVIVGALLSAGAAAIAVVEMLFLTTDLSAGYAMAGSLFAASALPLLVLAPFLWAVSERMGTRQYMIWSALVLACAAFFASLLTAAGFYLLPKMAFMLLLPLSAPMLVTLMQEVFQFARDKDILLFLFGLSAAVGAAVGALLGGSFAQYDLARGFGVAAAFFMLAALVSTRLPRHDRPASVGKVVLDPLARLNRAFSEDVRLLALLVFLVQAFWVARDMALPVLLAGRNFTAFEVGVAFSLTALGSAAGMFLARRLLGKNRPAHVLIVGTLLLGVTIVVMPLLVLPLLLGGAFLLGVGEAGISPAASDKVQDEAGHREAPQIIASLQSVGVLAWILAPLIIGLLLEAGVPAWLVLSLTGVAILLSYGALRKEGGLEGIVPDLRLRPRRRY